MRFVCNESNSIESETADRKKWINKYRGHTWSDLVVSFLFIVYHSNYFEIRVESKARPFSFVHHSTYFWDTHTHLLAIKVIDSRRQAFDFLFSLRFLLTVVCVSRNYSLLFRLYIGAFTSCVYISRFRGVFNVNLLSYEHWCAKNTTSCLHRHSLRRNQQHKQDKAFLAFNHYTRACC